MNTVILYYSGYGHTRMVAEHIKKGIKKHGHQVHLLSTADVHDQMQLLDEADTIVFGSPTYFGDVAAGFRQFMESTGRIWYNQQWQNKFAAGFTNSSTQSGDKLHTLMSIFLFASQHSMIWIPLGIMPKHDASGHQLGEPNGLGSYMGLMTVSGNDANGFSAPSDLHTAEAFGARIAALTDQLKNKTSLTTLNPVNQ